MIQQIHANVKSQRTFGGAVIMFMPKEIFYKDMGHNRC